MKPTVLFFAPVAFFKGGAENSLQDLLHNPAVNPVLVVPAKGPLQEQAEKDGFAVEVVPFGAIEEIHRPLKPAKIAKALMDSIKAAWRLARLTRQHEAVCLHTNGMKAHMLGMMARALGGAPVVAHVRDIAYTRAEKVIWKALALGCYRVVLVSRACWPGESLPANVVVVHNGIQLPGYPLPLGPDSKRPFRLGFCGRIDPIKGLDALMDWMAAANSAKLNVTLTVRGEGTPAYEAALKQRVDVLGIKDRVIFEGPRKGLDKIFAELDAVVVPSQTPDPLPRSVMESMAMGLPVLGYPAGGIPDMIVPGESGFLVKDGGDFVEALSVLMDKAQWVHFQQGARERARNGFSLDALYANLGKIYAPLNKTNR